MPPHFHVLADRGKPGPDQRANGLNPVVLLAAQQANVIQKCLDRLGGHVCCAP